jgi:hypothetical protein
MVHRSDLERRIVGRGVLNRHSQAIAHAGTPLCAFVRIEEAPEHARALGLIDAGVADGAKLEAMAADA